jgi:hypothetical protein
MTFDQACELARVINGNPRFAVIAIGRFAMQVELQAAYRGAVADKLPWGVSVMRVEDIEDRTIIRREEEWREFAAVRKPQPFSHPQPAPVTAPRPKPLQPSLFD